MSGAASEPGLTLPEIKKKTLLLNHFANTKWRKKSKNENKKENAFLRIKTSCFTILFAQVKRLAQKMLALSAHVA